MAFWFLTLIYFILLSNISYLAIEFSVFDEVRQHINQCLLLRGRYLRAIVLVSQVFDAFGPAWVGVDACTDRTQT